MTPLLQFLDTLVNKQLKDIMKERWEDWIENEEADLQIRGIEGMHHINLYLNGRTMNWSLLQITL